MGASPPILFKFWCIPVILFIFKHVPSHLKSVGHYGTSSVQKFASSACPSVTISFQLSILCTFQMILFKLYVRVDIGEE